MEQKQTYIHILKAALEAKLSILNGLLVRTKEQKICIEGGITNQDEFDQYLVDKDKLIGQLNEVDKGFDLVYQKVKEEIKINPARYKEEIKKLQDLIKSITDLSVELQALEKRNYISMQNFFASKKKEIRDYHVNSKSVANYYNRMADSHMGQSYFLDKKK